jgi:branched-chain amino acid transport system permease protein
MRGPDRSIVLIALAVLAAPIAIRSSYLLHLLIMWGIFSLVTLSLNVAFGFAGQLSLGHAGFWGIGAYASALAVAAGVPWLAAFLFAGLLTSVVGALVSVPFLRLRGIYLGMATLGFGEIVHLMLRNSEAITGGALGLRAIPAPRLFGLVISSQRAYAYLVLAVLALVALACIRLMNSAQGAAFRALSQDEIAAEAAAVNVTAYKIAAMALSCFIAGLSGSLLAHYTTYLSPENFTVAESLLILTMLIVGGRGNVLGSLAGAALLTLLPEALRSAPAIRPLLYGLMLMAVAVRRPQGILGGLEWGAATLDLGAPGDKVTSAA